MPRRVERYMLMLSVDQTTSECHVKKTYLVPWVKHCVTQSYKQLIKIPLVNTLLIKLLHCWCGSSFDSLINTVLPKHVMTASQSLQCLSWFTMQKHNLCVSKWSVSSPQSKQWWVNPCDTVIPVIYTSFVNKGANLGCVFVTDQILQLLQLTVPELNTL